MAPFYVSNLTFLIKHIKVDIEKELFTFERKIETPFLVIN
jgi:hypothetical protein